jgi:hypothetical protein
VVDEEVVGRQLQRAIEAGLGRVAIALQEQGAPV